MTADRIRDELKAEYNVFIEDRLRQWSVGGDFGPDSAARDESRFKPWTMCAYSEPLIDEDQESAILVQLEERNEAKAARNFDAADDIRDFLLSEYNVVIDDRLREWSIGGDFGTVRKRSGSDETYMRRGGGDLTSEQEAEIIDIVSVRAVAKKKRDFATADELRDVLDSQFDVKVDDKSKCVQ
jgi:cysteinyl-tRNA synthetase